MIKVREFLVPLLVLVILTFVCIGPLSFLTYLETFNRNLSISESHIVEHINSSRQNNFSRVTKHSISQHRDIVIWSQDHHIGPVQDLKHFFAIELGLKITWKDMSLSGSCHITDTCHGKNLKAFPPSNYWDLGPNKYLTRKAFYDHYQSEFENVDIFFCAFPMANCELFLPFNKIIIVIHTVPLELGRTGGEVELREWIELQNKLMNDKLSVVAANSLYNQKYVEYFSGITIPLLQSFCGYAHAYPPLTELFQRSKQVSRIFLLGGNGAADGESQFMAIVRHLTMPANSIIFARIKELYNPFKFEQLVAHPGVIFLPYTVSVMSFFEYYRACIPLFVPSVSLLIKLDEQYRMLAYRIYNGFHLPFNFLPFSPNDPSELATRFWLNFSDFYVMPHVIQFDSAQHLVDLLKSLTAEKLSQIRRHMKVYNLKIRGELASFWHDKFEQWDLFGPKRKLPRSYEREMMTRWSTLMLPNRPAVPWPFISCNGRNPGFRGQC